jgi:ADP-ribose pyrophosphatase
MKTWKTLGRKTVLDMSPFLTVEAHEVELPDGRRIEGWPWVVTPDYVNVVAVTLDGFVVCFRQVKYAVEGVALAPVGGYLEPGENPLTAAKRELLEEAGYVSQQWTSLGHYAVDGNRGAGTAWFFLARNARLGEQAESDDLEEQHLSLLRLDEVERAVDRCEIKSLAWAACFVMALRHLNAEAEQKSLS